ncbi:MAG TPA: hypothetical protein VGQ07_03915 [Nitrospirales bacterium]|nr:hypothetical protein [Nitrospirales bacterium]
MGWRLGITFAAVALLYLDPIPQSMALNSLDLATSLVDHRSLELDEYRGVDIAVRDGRIFSGTPPGAAFIAALVYGVTHPVFHLVPSHLALPVLYVLCTVLVGIPAGAITVYLVYRMAVHWGASVRNAALTAGLLAFGTMHLGYATGFYKNTLAAACLMGAFTLLMPIQGSQQGVSRASLAGLLCGLAIGFDYPSVLITTVLAGYFLWFRPEARVVAGFCAGAGMALLPVLLYHHAAFGSPWLTAYRFRTDSAAANLGWPQLGPFIFLLVTFVGASPCVIWSAMGWRQSFKKPDRREEMIAIAGIVLMMPIFFSGWAIVYSHEASFASRLLLPMLPFAVLPMAFGLPVDLKGWPLAVIGWSVAATVLATQASMIPSGTITPLYALKVLGTSWGTGPLFSVTLAGWLNLPTLHLAISEGIATTSSLLQPENRDLLVKVLLGQLLVKIMSLTVTVVMGYLLWRFIWRPVLGSQEWSTARGAFQNSKEAI